jgi:hypothetical protein
MAKGISDAEADAIFATFAEIEGYEETVEVSVATRRMLTPPSCSPTCRRTPVVSRPSPTDCSTVYRVCEKIQ